MPQTPKIEIIVSVKAGRSLYSARKLKDLSQKVCRCVMKNQKYKFRKTQLSVVAVGPGVMKQLNESYRDHPQATDVLSFPMIESECVMKSLPDDLGEVVLCFPYIKKQARLFEETFERELTRMLIHGMLHLLGFDHKNEKTAKHMFALQEHVLQQLIPGQKLSARDFMRG